MSLPTPEPSGAVLPEPGDFVGSSCLMLVIVIVTGSPSGSVTPVMVTARILWFGGQSVPTLGSACEQSGGSFFGTDSMLTASTEAWKKNWLSTSANRIRTVCPANALKSAVVVVGVFVSGSPGSVQEDVEENIAGRNRVDRSGRLHDVDPVLLVWFPERVEVRGRKERVVLIPVVEDQAQRVIEVRLEGNVLVEDVTARTISGPSLPPECPQGADRSWSRTGARSCRCS